MRIKNISLVSLGVAAGLSLSLVGGLNRGAGSGQEAVASAAPLAADVSKVTTPGAPSGAFDPNLFVNLSKQLVPSVVNISTSSMVRAADRQQMGPDEFFQHFFGGQPFGFQPGRRTQRYPGAPEKPQLRPMALGSGFVIDSKGLILTNNHVIDGADEVKVSFTESPEEKPTEAKVIARDPELDVAILKVKTDRKLVAAPLGDSDATQVGEFVLAIGNPFGQGHSVTQGIISAKGRPLPELALSTYLQTDAPINPGNSGGPLVNLKGEVIGINNAIDARGQGIGFAIPMNAVKKVLPQLEEGGSVTRGYIGLAAEPLSQELREKLEIPADVSGAVVAQTNPGEPAYRAGVQAYDVIMEFNGKPVRSPGDLVSRVTETEVGAKVPMKVLRNGKEVTLQVKIGKRNAIASR